MMNTPTQQPQPQPAQGQPQSGTGGAGGGGNAAAVTPYHSASLYVGDLAPDISEALLFELFNQVGPVASIRVCRDTVTRRSLGYAYVNFHNGADAERAIDTMNYSMIKNRPCRIMWSQRDPSIRRSGVGNIFVKNLDESVDNKILYDTFSIFGNILSCKVAIDPETGGPKGYGYVHYETAEAANEAIDKSDGMLIAEKKVHVGHFVRRNERAGQADWTNVYVKNMPLTWTEEKLREEFEKFGPITSCKIQTAPEPSQQGEEPEVSEGTDATTKSKGFGFVNFDEHESALKAVEALDGTSVGEGEDARDLVVCRAQKKSERQRELQQKYDQLKMERMNKYQGVNLYVKNLDETVTEEQVREAFGAHGTITSARIMKDMSTGQSKGFGFICFSLPEEATKAVQEMNNKMLAGKPIYVALAQRKEVRRAQLEAQYAQRYGTNQAGMAPRGPMGVQPGMYGMPYMMAGQPGMPQQPRQGYPMGMPQMMPRGAPRGRPLPYGGRGGAYPMPAYATMGQIQGQQPQRRSGGGRPRTTSGGRGGQRGMQNENIHPMLYYYAGQQRSNFKYTQQVRNQQGVGGPVDGNGQPQQVPTAAASESLDAAALAAATPEMQKNMIGERLYPLIHAAQPELAGKITGMLLEMDNGELLHLLESPDSLKSKIQEALQVSHNIYPLQSNCSVQLISC
ncbi:unnamed protein product [Chrysoparadoxa australica]